MPPAVSVIIPCHNAADFIGEAIESVIEQSGEPAEIIVSDDASTDASAAIAERFGPRIQLLRSADQLGPARARNVALPHATGRHLMFLDADDRLGPGALAALTAALDADPDPNLIAACPWRTLRLAPGGGWREDDPTCPWSPPYPDMLRAWMRGWYIPPSSILWKHTALETAGGWDEAQRYNSDGELMMRALLGGARVVQIDDGLSLYRRFGASRASLSTAYSHSGYLPAHMRIWERLEAELTELGRLDAYRIEIGRGYHVLARNFLSRQPELAGECVRRAARLAGRRAIHGTLAHRIGCNLLGMENKERLASLVRALRLKH